MDRVKKVLRIFLTIMILVNSIVIYKYNIDYQNTNDIENEIVEILKESNLNKNEAEYAIIENKNYHLIKALKAEYPDTVAFISIGNTNIQYPVVHYIDNEYYLNHSPNKKENSNGSVFLNSANASNFEDDNSIIYGHNVKTGKIFNNLNYFKSQQFYDENNIITINTEQETLRYKVFSVYTTAPDFQYKTPNFISSEEKANFIEKVALKSIINSGELLSSLKTTKFAEEAKILTLSTCESDEERLVVHAVLMDSEEGRQVFHSND